jgi:hypothetical protein
MMAALFVAAGCATPYAFRFDLADPAAGDDDVSAAIRVDPTGSAALQYEVTNKTDQVLQVHWTQIAMRHPDGTTSTLRPDADLGWIQPGATMIGWLGPFVLPNSGPAAAAYDGRSLELEVPMTVRQEARVYRYQIAVHAQPLQGSR